MPAASDRATSAPRPGRHWWAAVTAIAAAGLAARIIGARDSLAWDEIYLLSIVRNASGLHSLLDAIGDSEKTPALGFVLAWLARSFGGPIEIVRVPAVIASTALIPLNGLLARKVFGPKAGLIAAALMAASPFALFYASEARAYSLTTALGLGATLALVEATRSAGNRGWWIAYSLLSASALLSHYTVFPLLLALIAWAFIARPERRRPLVLAQLGPVAFGLAWSPWLITQFGNAGGELERIHMTAPLSADTILTLAARLTASDPIAPFDRIPGQVGTWLIIGGALIAIAALVTSPKGSLRDAVRLDRGLLMLVLLGLSSIVFLTAASALPGKSFLLARNAFVSLPALIALASGIAVASKRLIGILGIVALIAGLAIGSATELSDFQRPAMRQAASAIESRWRPGDIVVTACCLNGIQTNTFTAFTEYLPKRIWVQSLRPLSAGGAVAAKVAFDSGRSVFFVYQSDPAGTPAVGGFPTGIFPSWQRVWPGRENIAVREYRGAASGK